MRRFAVFTWMSFASFCAANAAERNDEMEEDRGYSAPFGRAGCGPGSMLVRDKDKGSQLMASLINTYAMGIVTSAVSTGTSNCNYTNDTAVTEQKVYISVNLGSLERDAAQGSGRHLFALGALFGCENREAKVKFAEFNKSNFDVIYITKDPEQVFKNFKRAAKDHHEIADVCSALG